MDQYDQRADSAEQCVKLLCSEEEPLIRSAITYVIAGEVDEAQMYTSSTGGSENTVFNAF